MVVDALAQHLADFPAAKSSLGDLVFTTPEGAPWRRSALSLLWRAPGKSAGLDPAPTFHELRHFYASLLIRRSESVKTVQIRLGHATAAETLDTYSHLWPIRMTEHVPRSTPFSQLLRTTRGPRR